MCEREKKTMLKGKIGQTKQFILIIRIFCGIIFGWMCCCGVFFFLPVFYPQPHTHTFGIIFKASEAKSHFFASEAKHKPEGIHNYICKLMIEKSKRKEMKIVQMQFSKNRIKHRKWHIFVLVIIDATCMGPRQHFVCTAIISAFFPLKHAFSSETRWRREKINVIAWIQTLFDWNCSNKMYQARRKTRCRELLHYDGW